MNTNSKQVAQEVAALRPDLCTDGAVTVALEADPTLTAKEVIEILDQATEDARMNAEWDAANAARDARLGK